VVGAIAQDGTRFKLRVEAQAAMTSALGCLDQLGDEGPAAATLQHAIDRLSYQASDKAVRVIHDSGSPQ
jgi:hypothetical protein